MTDPKTRLAEIRAAVEQSLSDGAGGDRFPARDLVVLLERIAHLEGLVRDVEWGGARGCPWCDTIGGVEVGVDQQTGLECAFHHAECPAFTANGEIK